MANEALQPYLEQANPDEALAARLEEAIRRVLPDSGKVLDAEIDANLIDMMRLFSSMIVAYGTKGAGDDALNFIVNGLNFKLDASTNIISGGTQQEFDDVALNILNALAALGTGVAIGAIAGSFGLAGVVAVGATVVGFAVGNAVSSYIPDIVDAVFGAKVSYYYQQGNNYVSLITNSSFTSALESDWDPGDNTGMQSYVSKGREFEFISNHPFDPFKFHFNQGLFTFPDSTLEELRYRGEEFDELIIYNQKDFRIQTNGLEDEIRVLNLIDNSIPALISMAKNDQDVMYALKHLRSYALVGYEAINPQDYSNAYIEDRAAMLYYYNQSKTHPLGVDFVNDQLLSYKNEYFYDMATGIEFGQGLLDVDYDKKVIFGTDGAEEILGDNDADRLYGVGGADTLRGGEGADKLYGGTENDILIAGISQGADGNDNDAKDYLEGGKGDDTYYVNNQDVIFDSDNTGSIFFNGISLDGVKTKLEEAPGHIFVYDMDKAYEDENFIYQEDNGSLRVSSKDIGGGEFFIEKWDNETKEGLNIKLIHNPKDVKIKISNETVTEGDSARAIMLFRIESSRELTESESITLTLNIDDINTNAQDYDISSLPDTITLTKDNSLEIVEVYANGDADLENDEYFYLNATVSSQTGLDDAEIKVDAGVGTIENDDGTPTVNYIQGTSKDETLNGTNGRDRIFGEGGADIIHAGLGDDEIVASSGSKLYGGLGKDIFNLRHPDSDNYHVYGEHGDDTIEIYSDSGNSLVDGGEGKDTILVNYGLNYEVYGGLDNDSIELRGIAYSNISSGDGDDNIVLTTTFGNALAAVSDNTIYTGKGNDTVQIGEHQHNGGTNNTLYTGEGEDIITLWQSDDNRVYTGDDKDEITVRTSKDDTIDTGDGNDEIFFRGASNNSEVYGRSGNDVFIDQETDDSFQSENLLLYGGQGNDTFTNINNSEVYGEGGQDTFNIGENSEYYGGKDNDTFYIGTNSSYEGGGDNDTFYISAETNPHSFNIKAEAGDDNIVIQTEMMSGSNSEIELGDGNNTITYHNIGLTSSTIKGGG